MSETLYELTGDYLALLDMAEDPDIDEDVFSDTLEALGGLIEVKAEGYARVIAELEGNKDIEMAKANKFLTEYGRHKDRADRIGKRIEKIRSSLANAMFVTGKTKFDTENFKFSAKESVSTVIDDVEKIPDSFCRFKKEPNKTEIKKAINDGFVVAGAHLESKKGVTIK